MLLEVRLIHLSLSKDPTAALHALRHKLRIKTRHPEQATLQVDGGIARLVVGFQGSAQEEKLRQILLVIGIKTHGGKTQKPHKVTLATGRQTKWVVIQPEAVNLVKSHAMMS
jgi:hypothetical protein